MPEKAEDTKPDNTGDKTTDEDPLAEARAEAIRQNPQWQTQQLDTSDSTQHVDIRTVSPAFEEARQQAVRAAAEAVEGEGYLPANVIPPDDENDSERAREDVLRQAADLPEDTSTPRSANAPDGQGGPYGQGVIPSEEDQKIAEEQERKAQESSKTESKPSSSTTKSTAAKTTSRSTSTTSKNTTK